MCRNIRTLFNFEPPATEDEIRASALQFVRKLSGFTRPSQATRRHSIWRSRKSPRPPANVTSLKTHAPANNRERKPRRPAPGRPTAMREARPMDREGGANVYACHDRQQRCRAVEILLRRAVRNPRRQAEHAGPERGAWSRCTTAGGFMITAPNRRPAGYPRQRRHDRLKCSSRRSRERVDAWHKAGTGEGGHINRGPARGAPGAAGQLYLAYLRDPDGNKLCALHRMPG